MYEFLDRATWSTWSFPLIIISKDDGMILLSFSPVKKRPAVCILFMSETYSMDRDIKTLVKCSYEVDRTFAEDCMLIVVKRGDSESLDEALLQPCLTHM